MKSIFKKVLAVMISAIFVLAAPVASFADSFQPGQDSEIVLEFFAQNSDSEEESWLWVDYGDSLGLKFYIGVADHYVMDIPEGTYDGMRNPNNSFGFMVDYYGPKNGGRCDIGMSFQNVILKFNGYDDFVIPALLSTEADEVSKSGFRFHLNKLLPNDGNVDVADMLRNLTTIEFDAAVIYINVVDGDGNEIIVEPKETEPEVTEPEETTVKETTAEETTTVKETTAKETTVEKTTAAKETTAVESAEEDDTVEETVPATTEESKKDSGDTSSIKIIVTIVFAVILLAALGFVAFTYVKKK